MKLRGKILAAALLIASFGAVMKGAATLPTGFQQTIVFSGLTQPTAVRFARDGRVFIAEKSGIIKVFDTLSSTTPTIFADLTTEVDDYWDRGLLGLELHPNFPDTPYVYVLYSYDFDPVTGAGPPAWNDNCPNPPGATTNGCTILGRLSRLTANGNHMTGTEQVLLESWGQQFQSHSIGDLHFGADGALYISSGDGASTVNVDYGQYGSPKNPLADPPVPKGGLADASDGRGRCAAISKPLAMWRADPSCRAAPLSAWTPTETSFRTISSGGIERRDRATDHRVRPAQSLPLHDPAGHRSGLDRRRGLERLGGDQRAR